MSAVMSEDSSPSRAQDARNASRNDTERVRNMTEMTQEWTGNGTADETKARKARVKFGPKPTQNVPHEWAEAMLSYMFKHQKRAFASALRNAAGIDDDE
jgi:hypothetical protein